ncbi:hypothetical protein BCU88_22140 [Vibrio splendidus]|nr:hypothetical protein BCU88_22140 [Vibrio splendidus]
MMCVRLKLVIGLQSLIKNLITTHRKNMKLKVLATKDRAMLSKRSLIETINDQLKNISDRALPIL